MPSNTTKIYIGADHGGFEMKGGIKEYLEAKGIEVEDLGAYSLDPLDDYPQIAVNVAKAVAGDDGSFGILLCRSGQGTCMVANKIKGIRAALSWNEKSASAGRRNDHANVLCLPSDYLNQKEAQSITDAFLVEEPARQEKYLRRIKQIEEMEKN